MGGNDENPRGASPWPSRFVEVAWVACAVVVTIAVVPGCFFAGSCSEEDRRLAEGIPHYGEVQLEFFDDPEAAGCAAQLEVQAARDDVLDHYRRALEADGWDVLEEEETDADLAARRGEAEVTIYLETFEGQVSAAIRVNA